MKVKDMEVWCVELEEINTIGYFAQKLAIKKIYNIKDVLNNPNKTAGGCHFCTPEFGLDNPEFVEKPKIDIHKIGYTVLCKETGETWISVKAAAEANGFHYNFFKRYLEKVELGDTKADFEGRHYEVIAARRDFRQKQLENS